VQVTVTIIETTDGDGWVMSLNGRKPVLAPNPETALAAVQEMRKKLPGRNIQVHWRTVTRLGAARVQALKS
jgi:hypothetical protein